VAGCCEHLHYWAVDGRGILHGNAFIGSPDVLVPVTSAVSFSSN
jgi:hypothetical protein